MISRDLAVRTNATVATRNSTIPNFLLEDTTIVFPNFSGRATEYNMEGDRNFNVVLTDEQAAILSAQGWNVRTKEGRDEEDAPRHILKVSIGYKFYPPKIYMLTQSQMQRRQRTAEMSEDLLGLLDDVEYSIVDLIIRPHRWDKGGKSGIKAWAKTLVIVIAEDDLQRKYGDFIEDTVIAAATIPEIQANNDPDEGHISWDMIEEPS